MTSDLPVYSVTLGSWSYDIPLSVRHKMSVQMCKNTENWPEKEFVCEARTCVKNTKRNKNNYLIIRGHTKALVSFQ